MLDSKEYRLFSGPAVTPSTTSAPETPEENNEGKLYCNYYVTRGLFLF